MTPPVPESSTITSERPTSSTTVSREAPTKAKRPERISPNVDLGSPDLQPGASLEIEAFDLLDQRRFAEAMTLAGALGRLRPDDIIPDAITAVAGANLRWKRSGSAAANRLRERLLAPSDLKTADAETRRRHAIGWGAMSSYFLAFNDYRSADHAARQLMAIDADSSTAWWQLAASYAGLGWFTEAEQCLGTARAKTPNATGSDGIAPMARWQIGRSVNRWAQSKTPAIWLSALLWIFVGLLSCAVYLTTPFLARELRVAKLDGEMRDLANEHWATDVRRRVMIAAAVAGIIALWILGLVLLNPASR